MRIQLSQKGEKSTDRKKCGSQNHGTICIYLVIVKINIRDQ